MSVQQSPLTLFGQKSIFALSTYAKWRYFPEESTNPENHHKMSDDGSEVTPQDVYTSRKSVADFRRWKAFFRDT
jgi:hypothetical protein